ncbi:MAG: 5-formyltetrahydrofolate cyclo-ligase, partial [Mariprofundaceae bacterium]|nr:5-formyltetrahydrofolate cyclo-ligase [Mariprofundaceae bacterium]
MNNKQQLRQHRLALRRGLSQEARQRSSEQNRQRLQDTLASHHPHLNDAPLLIYRSLDDEVDTTTLFETMPGRDIYAPVTHHAGEMHWRRVNDETLWQRGDFGVQEPTS